MRAVIDTNVWVSALLNRKGSPARVLAALREGLFTLVTSEPLLEELADVLGRPRIVSRYGVSSWDVRELLSLLRERAEFVVVSGTLHLCRDPDDDVLIETAVVGKAEALVTRDDDLKASAEVQAPLEERGVLVLTVRRFLDTLPPLQTS